MIMYSHWAWPAVLSPVLECSWGSSVRHTTDPQNSSQTCTPDLSPRGPQSGWGPGPCLPPGVDPRPSVGLAPAPGEPEGAGTKIA